jgi:hypothetical protein
MVRQSQERIMNDMVNAFVDCAHHLHLVYSNDFTKLVLGREGNDQ